MTRDEISSFALESWRGTSTQNELEGSKAAAQFEWSAAHAVYDFEREFCEPHPRPGSMIDNATSCANPARPFFIIISPSRLPQQMEPRSLALLKVYLHNYLANWTFSFLREQVRWSSPEAVRHVPKTEHAEANSETASRTEKSQESTTAHRRRIGQSPESLGALKL